MLNYQIYKKKKSTEPHVHWNKKSKWRHHSTAHFIDHTKIFFANRFPIYTRLIYVVNQQLVSWLIHLGQISMFSRKFENEELHKSLKEMWNSSQHKLGYLCLQGSFRSGMKCNSETYYIKKQFQVENVRWHQSASERWGCNQWIKLHRDIGWRLNETDYSRITASNHRFRFMQPF